MNMSLSTFTDAATFKALQKEEMLEVQVFDPSKFKLWHE
jgi:hypothetical protein